MRFGIDVSSAQGVIDWNQTAPLIDFAIIHMNSGMTQQPETRLLYNASECERLNVPYGLYWFCYALSAQDAYSDGLAAGQIIANNNLNLTYPVYLDVERTGDYSRPGTVENWINNGITPTPAFCQGIIEAFASGLTSTGNLMGLYFNAGMYTEFQYQNMLPNHTDWSKWIAQYPTQPTWETWDFWQYDPVGTIAGISGQVDFDYMNDGYHPPTPPGPYPTPTLSNMPIWLYLKPHIH